VAHEPQQHPTSPDDETSPPVVGAGLKWLWAVLGVLGGALLLAIWQPTSGFGDKTLWDWLELLIVPLALAVIAYLFSRFQRREDHAIAAEQRQQDREIAGEERETERSIARDRNEEMELQNYFDRMSELMLTHNLHSQPEDETDTPNRETAATIARSRTLAVLRSIQKPVRKGSVVRFLSESKLIDVINLQAADLKGARLWLTDLHGANLEMANLARADLQAANLEMANLQAANLQAARLQVADLHGANLAMAFLSRANLLSANLQAANLEGAYLQGAHLEGAYLEGVKTDARTNFEGVIYNNATTPPPGGFPASAINVDEQGEG
jgi:hypothetical protein